MLPIRIKAVSESDLRMLGNLARNIQRVLPVTQADIDAAAALGKSWVVWKAIEVNDPIDNLRGGTQLVIKQNSIAPGENVRRVLIISGPSGQVVVIGPDESPLLLPDAIANTLSYVKAFGGTEQNGTPTPADPVDIVSNNGVLKVDNQGNVYADGTVETIEDTIGNTATTEMLLSVDTYTDQQEVISGSITRKCGVVILDSSFEWTYDSTYGRVNATIPNLWGSTVARTIPGFCTHFEWLSHQESISSITAGQCYSAGANRIFLHISQTSAAAFAAWLDAQKDAGTPVIIVFPLENTTTETVTGQTLQVANGDNTLTITQAGMNGLQLEAEYKKAV